MVACDEGPDHRGLRIRSIYRARHLDLKLQPVPPAERDPPGIANDIHREEERRSPLSHQALRYCPALEMDLERRGIVGAGAAPDAAGNLGHVVADEPKKHVDQVRAQVEQRAAASHQQALELYRDFGNLAGVADTLNNLGGLSSRTSATHQARDHHNQALVLARNIGVPLEEARALEGIGRSHLQDGHPGEGLACLCQALGIYQRIGSSRAQRVQETLRQYGHEPAALSPPTT